MLHNIDRKDGSSCSRTSAMTSPKLDKSWIQEWLTIKGPGSYTNHSSVFEDDSLIPT